MKTYLLKEISKNIYYGKMPLSVLDIGPYPIFTGYKISGYSNEFNLDKDEVVVIARGVGGTGDVKFSPQKCFLSNIAIAIIADEQYVIKKYLYYYFQVNTLRYLRTGSAQPQITIKDLENVKIEIPSIEIQQQILDCIEPFDKKISLNDALNDNLEGLFNVFCEGELQGGLYHRCHIRKGNNGGLGAFARRFGGVRLWHGRRSQVVECGHPPGFDCRLLEQGRGKLRSAEGDGCRPEVPEASQILQDYRGH